MGEHEASTSAADLGRLPTELTIDVSLCRILLRLVPYIVTLLQERPGVIFGGSCCTLAHVLAAAITARVTTLASQACGTSPCKQKNSLLLRTQNQPQ